LDAGDELLVEAEKAAGAGWSVPVYNPEAIAEREATLVTEREAERARSIAYNQPLANLGTLSEQMAKAAGRSLESLSEGERDMLARIEADQLQVHQGRISMGTCV
jgi:hypothetical protein